MSVVFFKKTTLHQLLQNPSLILEILNKANFSSYINKHDFLGIKIHFGEKGNKSHINPKILSPLVRYLKKLGIRPFLFDTNTLYRGQRTNAVDHINLAYQHGFGKLNIPIIIGDGLRGNSYFKVEINQRHFSECFIASIIEEIDFMLVLSHFTGHMLTGFGASIKNTGMGCASRRGKLAQHSVVSPKINISQCKMCRLCIQYCPEGAVEEESGKLFINPEKCIGCAQCISICPSGAVKITWSEEYEELGEKMVEYAYAVTGKVRCAYFNFCLYITKECDCMNKEEKGFIDDLGVLFSWDPVSIDKASIDLLVASCGEDFLKAVYPKINYLHHLEYAERIGLGSLDYKLVEM